MENQDTLTPEQVAEIENLPFNEAAGKILGKEFPDIASAGKAIKDTFKHVTEAGESRKAIQAVMEKKGLKAPKEAVDFILSSLESAPAPAPAAPAPAQEAKPEFDSTKFVSREEFDKKDFYASNPDLKAHEDLVETFVKANPGKSRAEVVQLPTFKTAFDGVKVVKQKSIMHSDPKIGPVGDKMHEAREKASSGSAADIKEAGNLATKAVIDAFDI